jgi:branched-subunit amino acid aminotransferase/4-amino-4-deoxychorismate lyase
VLTFGLRDEGVVVLAEDISLTAASERLPPGSYTTLRTYGAVGVVRFGAHLRRLEESATLQGRPGKVDAAGARRLVAGALRRTRYLESRLRLTFAPPELFVVVEPFMALPRCSYEQGVACATVTLQRQEPRAKDTRFITTAQRAYGELSPGIEEGLLVAPDGAILEGLSSNFFALLAGSVRTAQKRVLLGITRGVVMELAGARYPVVRRPVLRRESLRLQEAFLTSASRGVLPVTRIDGEPVGEGAVGPKTRTLMEDFAALVRREAETFR